jgi:hypothetical protein
LSHFDDYDWDTLTKEIEVVTSSQYLQKTGVSNAVSPIA